MPSVKKESSEEEQLKLTAIHDLDGVAPKAVPEDVLIGDSRDTMALNPDTQTGIQFIPAQTNNADAKVELGSVPVPTFVGLGKEELMKYANDPFWIRLRWFLFILFWLIWLGMLAGAIVIIIMAPKCPEVPNAVEAVKENGPFYQVFLSKFSDNGIIKNLDKRVEYIKGLGFKSIIISQPFETKTQDPASGISEVVNFTNIHPTYGTLAEFKEVVGKFKQAGIKVILQVIPNHSSRDHPWFKEHGSEFYVFKSKEEAEKSTWKSFYKANAWTPVNASDPNSDFYLHQFKANEADLNYKSDKVIAEMNGALKFWYEAGVDGFLLSDVSYLIENLNSLEDQNSTINNPQNAITIRTKLIDSSKWTIPEGRKGPFAMLDFTDMNLKNSLAESRGPVIPVLADLRSLPTNYTETDLNQHFGTDIGSQFVLRRFSGPRYVNLLDTYRSNPDRAYTLELISLLVNGEVIVYYGDEKAYTAVPSSGDQLDINLPRWTPEGGVIADFFRTALSEHNKLKGGETKFYADKGLFGFRRVTPERTVVVIANIAGGHHENVNLQQFLKAESKIGEVIVATPQSSLVVGKADVDMTNVEVLLGKAVAILETPDPLANN